MIDPWKNATYAARFLAELHQELGDWTRAAGAYHSRTDRYAKRYVRRFERIRATLPKGAQRVASLSEGIPTSGLLPAAAGTDGPIRSGNAHLGSLVPRAATAGDASLPLISMNERTSFGDFIRD